MYTYILVEQHEPLWSPRRTPTYSHARANYMAMHGYAWLCTHFDWPLGSWNVLLPNPAHCHSQLCHLDFWHQYAHQNIMSCERYWECPSQRCNNCDNRMIDVRPTLVCVSHIRMDPRMYIYMIIIYIYIYKVTCTHMLSYTTIYCFILFHTFST